MGNGNLRIVVVEDEIFIRLDLVTHLGIAGHKVVGTADCAEDAVSTVERERPDIVLMDVRLSGERDGIDAALEIWRRFNVRSLFVSANLDASARTRAAPANPVGFLEKPFTRANLLAALSAAA
jgi:two-component system, response regulator PdtaR